MSATDDETKLSRHNSSADEGASLDAGKLQHELEAERAAAGVTRIEALYVVFGGWKIWIMWAAVLIIMYAYSLESNTTYNYLTFATSSFGEHSALGTVQTADTIISAASLPFIAKLADITSRPTTFLIVLAFYTVGLAITAGSTNVGTVCAGQLLYTIGNAGVNILITILLADLVPLKWRGMSFAISSAPYIINGFVAAYIVDDIELENWRWGYGMFCIVIPAAFIPLLGVLYWGDWKAKRIGALSIASSSYARRQALEKEKANEPQKSYPQLVLHFLKLIDAAGLILFGTGLALILLPFTLTENAKGGWHNPSMIAMEVVGWVILIGFGAYEWNVAPFPLLPRRILNRTFLCCAFIDAMYEMGGYIQGEYYSSWYYVTKFGHPWDTKDYTYFGNCLSVALCVFAFPGGLAMWYFRSYKWPQLFGICARIVGMGLILLAVQHPTDVNLVWAQLMIGLGGGFSVITTQAGSQGSVPHSDVATAIAALSLITTVSAAIGDAIAAAIWTNKMPANLAKYVLAVPGTNQTLVDDIYGSIVVANEQTGAIRDAVLQAYNKTFLLPMALPGLILAILPIAACLYTKDVYLGNTQNAVETGKELHIHNHDAAEEELARKAREVEEQEKHVVEKVAPHSV